jgi:hypothetical protein
MKKCPCCSHSAQRHHPESRPRKDRPLAICQQTISILKQCEELKSFADKSPEVSKGFQLFTLLQRQNAFLFRGSTAWITPKIIDLAKCISMRRVLAEIGAF